MPPSTCEGGQLKPAWTPALWAAADFATGPGPKGASRLSHHPERMAITQPRVARHELPWEHASKNYVLPSKGYIRVRPGRWDCRDMPASKVLSVQISWACRAASCTCRNLACRSCALINQHRFPADGRLNVLVEARAKIHLATMYRRQLLTVAKVTKADALQRARLKLRRHIHITALGIEVRPQHRAEQAQLPDASRSAELRNLLAVNLDRQIGDSHAPIFSHHARPGNPQSSPPRLSLPFRPPVSAFRYVPPPSVLSAETVSSRMVWSFPSPQTQPASNSPRKSRGKRPLEDGPKSAQNLHNERNQRRDKLKERIKFA
jgi:hypothetical protein